MMQIKLSGQALRAWRSWSHLSASRQKMLWAVGETGQRLIDAGAFDRTPIGTQLRYEMPPPANVRLYFLKADFDRVELFRIALPHYPKSSD